MNGVMIALLPSAPAADWTKVDLPHLTLVYAGDKNDLSPTDFSNLAKDASSLAALAQPLYLAVAATEQFGEGADQVTAFRMVPSIGLWAMRRFLEKWNKSEYTDFVPHVTIGPAFMQPVDYVPQGIRFDTLYFGWGDDSLAFSLTGRGFDY